MTIATQNIGHGAGRLDAHPDIPVELHGADRWQMLVERLTSVDIDVLILNELSGWDMPRLEAAAADLGLKAIGIAPSRSGYPTGLCYREDVIELVEFNDKHDHAWHHGAAVAAFKVPGLPEGQLLAVGGIHVAPFAWRRACDEVSTLVYRACRYGDLGIVAGDFNWPPLVGKKPDYAKMKDYNRMVRLHNPPAWEGPTGRAARWLLKVLGILPRPRKSVAKTLWDGGFRDAAALLYRRTRDRSYLDYTCPSERLDWVAVSKPIAAAVVDYQLLTEPRWASDHEGVAATVEIDDIDCSNLKPYF